MLDPETCLLREARDSFLLRGPSSLEISGIESLGILAIRDWGVLPYKLCSLEDICVCGKLSATIFCRDSKT